MANRNAKALMQAQWERDDLVAKRSAGKQAAKDVLSELVAAVELFDVRHWSERKTAMEAEFGRRVHENLLGPSHADLEPHYREVRHRLLEIPDSEVADRIREIVSVMWNHDEAIQHGDRLSVTAIGGAVEQAAEAVLAAYIQERPIPNLSEIPHFRRIQEAVDAARIWWERAAEEAAAVEAAMEEDGPAD
jgi:plasmid stabilization system protein ParE